MENNELQEIPLNLISNEFGEINKDVLRNFENEGWSIISIRNQQVILQRKVEKGRKLEMNKIEYKEVKFKDISDENNRLSISVLNKMGEEGWELSFVSGGRVIFKRVIEAGQKELVGDVEIKPLTELEEKQAFIYKEISDNPEIKHISMKYKNGDKISLEIKSDLEKIRLISHILEHNAKECGTLIIPLFSNVKNYYFIENKISIELLNPIKEFTQEVYDSTIKSMGFKFAMEGVISLEIQF